MKRWMMLLFAMLLCAFAAQAALCEGEVTLTPVSDSLRDAHFIYATNLLMVPGENGYSVCEVDGTPLTDAAYDNLSGRFEYLLATSTQSVIPGAYGLLDMQGNELIPFDYTYVEVLGEHWAIGVRLIEATQDDYDYDPYSAYAWGTGLYLKIDTVDVYHLPEGRLVKTLTRDEFEMAGATQNCVNIKNRATGEVTTYDETFTALGTVDNVYDDKYDPGAYETFRTDDGYGIRDAGGIALEGLQSDGAILISYNAGCGYLFMPAVDGKVGIVNEQAEVLVPLEYDEIAMNSGYAPIWPLRPSGYSVDFAVAGYFGVWRDGKVAFFSLEGRETCPLTYTRDNSGSFGTDRFTWLGVFGASALIVDEEDQLCLLAADGVKTPLDENCGAFAVFYGNGMLYEVQDDSYLTGLIDWHGQTLLPCAYSFVEISADGKYLLACIDYEIDEIYEIAYPQAQ